MASENQLRALEKWLKHELPAGHDICEMPGEVCSDALSRLHEASELFKIDHSKKGIVLKVKQAIVSELQKDGYLDIRIGVDQTLDAEQNQEEERVRILEAEAKAEAQRIREEQGRAPVPTTIPIPATKINQPELLPPEQKLPPAAPKPTQAGLITKYVELLAAVTEAINAEDRIPEREKGYGIKFVFYSVKAALENGGSQEEA